MSSLIKKSIIASEQITKGLPFSSFPIVVTSCEIQMLIKKIQPTMDLLPFESEAVIHKHMLRDRSDILSEREKNKRG